MTDHTEPTIRKRDRDAVAPETNSLEKKLTVGKAASEWLSLSDASRRRLLIDIASSEGVDASFLLDETAVSLSPSRPAGSERVEDRAKASAAVPLVPHVKTKQESRRIAQVEREIRLLGHPLDKTGTAF